MQCAGVQYRRRRAGQIRRDVVPKLRQVALVEQIFDLIIHVDFLHQFDFAHPFASHVLGAKATRFQLYALRGVSGIFSVSKKLTLRKFRKLPQPIDLLGRNIFVG